MKETEQVRDLAYKVFHKISDMLITVAIAYKRVFMEPYKLNNPPIYYNLDMYPSNDQLMNIYSRVIHLPSRYIETFEEACYTGFFESADFIFSPYEVFINTRHKRYEQHLHYACVFPGGTK